MVLWEITVGTAYFLGLKRTYKLALRIQRKLVSSKHPRLRAFLHRRTRAVFDIALKVHKNIQQRDLEVGRSIGNWILRWLDRAKPSAEIRKTPHPKPSNGATSTTNMTKQVTNSSQMKTPGSNQPVKNHDSDRHLFTASRTILPKAFPTISMTLRQPRAGGIINQFRHYSNCSSGMSRPSYVTGINGFEGVIRKDIMWYLMRN